MHASIRGHNMAQNQNTMASSSIKMDSRKFLSALNDSAQARVSFFSEKVEEMGKLAGKQWRLAALRSKDLFIEDVNDNQFFVASHTKDQGRIAISNIRSIEVVEGEKAGLFEDSCLRLVNAIEENDQSKMSSAFGRMKAQRFSGRTVPASGVVRTRDGIIRNISVSQDGFNESVKDKLVSTIVESLQDKVIVENGQVTAGYFNDGQRFRLPVTKWATRKLVARKMRDAANTAYQSQGFQERILAVSNMIAENKIENAIKTLAPFLMEMEEFTLLNRKQVSTLIENTLATQGVFNQQLCDDTSTLFFKTNLKVSKNKIVKEWKAIARNAEHPVLAENVQILSESKNFEASYNKFLHLVFEAISNRQVAAESLATTLQVLRDKTPKIKESHDLSSKLMSLISRLKRSDFDDSAIYEAEDLIATIQEELSASESLKDFDSMPGDMGGAGGGMNAPVDAISNGGGKGQPIININSPLIQIGGSSGSAEEEELEPEMPPSEDDELDSMLGGDEELAPAPGAPAPAPAPAPAGPGAAGAPAAPAAPAPPRFESRNRFSSLNESRPLHYEMNDENDDLSDDTEENDQEIEESNDPYAFSGKGKSSYLMEYGSPVIKDEADLDRVVGLMRRLAVEHNLTGRDLAENLDDMAEASIEAVGLRVPEARMEAAIEQAVQTFISEAKAPFPGAAKPFGKKHKDDEDSDEDSDESEGNPFATVKESLRPPKPTTDPAAFGPGKVLTNDTEMYDVFERDSYDKEYVKVGTKTARQLAQEHGPDWDDVVKGGYIVLDRDIYDAMETGNLVDLFARRADGTPAISRATGGDEGDGFAEDQFKSARMKKAGYGRAGMTASKSKKGVASEGRITWLEQQEDAAMGMINGVNFILDHGGAASSIQPVILSEDGISAEIPIPAKLVKGALASAGLAKGDSSAFTRWLTESVEQLRGASSEEDQALNEAMAVITTGKNGSMKVELSGDIDVDDEDIDDEDMDEMKPVDAVEIEPVDDTVEVKKDLDGDEMPDFDKDDESDEEGEDDESDDDDDDEDEEGLAEDMDITAPSEGGYNKVANADRREVPKHAIVKKGNGNKLEGMGPDLKTDDGKGSNPPFARKGGKK